MVVARNRGSPIKTRNTIVLIMGNPEEIPLILGKPRPETLYMFRRLAFLAPPSPPMVWSGRGGGGHLRDWVVIRTSQSQQCQQSQGLGVWNAEDSVYKIQNMSIVTGTG